MSGTAGVIPERTRRQWAETRLLGDTGGMVMVVHGADRAGQVSWRKVLTGQTSFGWALGIGLAPEFRGRGYGTEAQRLMVQYLFAHTQVNRVEATLRSPTWPSSEPWKKPASPAKASCAAPRSARAAGHDQVIYSVLRDEVTLAAADPAFT